MALYATNRFAGDGVTTSREINFVDLYIAKEHVRAYHEDDTTKVRTPITLTEGNWLNASTLQALPPTPVGSTLVVHRVTPKPVMVDFTNGSRFTEHNVDLVARQGLMVAVEAMDQGTDGGAGVSPTVDWADVTNKPAASAGTAGLVKVGAGLAIDGGGVLSATGVGGSTPLSSITVPGGTAPGQVPTFDGASLVMQTPSGGGGSADPVIVYIGDSLGSDHPNLGPSPAVHLERTLRAGGYACRVVNLSVNGFTFNKANTQAVFGAQTMVQRAIALAPVAVITALGFNDTVMGVDGRSSAQVNSDATAFFQALRTGLPSAVIVAGLQLAYDRANFTPATLKNRGALPALMTLRTTGILTGCWSSEILEDTMGGAMQTAYANYAALDTHIRGLGTTNAFITLDLWKIARLGLTATDGLHLTEFGSRLVATTWRKAFTTVASLAALSPNLRALNYGPFDGFMNTDGTVETGGLWDLLMQSAGSDWSLKPFDPAAQHTNHQGGPWTQCNPAAWFLPSKGAYKPSTLNYVTGTTFSWELRNVAPSTDIQASTDGAAFVTIGQTTHYGGYLGSGILPLSVAGTYVFRYKVGNEIHGPVSLVVTVGSSSGGWSPKVISGANLATTPQSIATANARTYINFDGTNVTSSHAHLTHTKVGAESRIRVEVPSGKEVWVRLGITQLVSASAGANTLWMLGAELMNDSATTLYNIQLDAKYSPTTDYALVLTGTFVGKLTATTLFVPWVLTSAASTGAIASSATNGFSSFWSLEVITEL